MLTFFLYTCFFADSKSFGMHYMVGGWTRTNGCCYSRCSACRKTSWRIQDRKRSRGMDIIQLSSILTCRKLPYLQVIHYPCFIASSYRIWILSYLKVTKDESKKKVAFSLQRDLGVYIHRYGLIRSTSCDWPNSIESVFYLNPILDQVKLGYVWPNQINPECVWFGWLV